MLQQTRVQAVVPYYERFLERFPTVEALAAAPETDLLACWSGLGYYSRARNMQQAARQILDAGAFPRDYAGLLALPGIGPYTAAAVASIAFGVSRAALDGNAVRVFSRIFNARADLEAPAESLLAGSDPAAFNQAVMELGATVCLPRQPLCHACPVARFCEARAQGTAAELPAKRPGRAPLRIAGTLLLVRRGDAVLLRPPRRVRGFWELPALEDVPGARLSGHAGTVRHSITHHRYTLEICRAAVARKPRGWLWAGNAQMAALPVSTITRKALKFV